MLYTENDWFADIPWDNVLTVNKELCEKAENCPHGLNSTGYGPAKELWERSISQTMTFREALDICRRVHQMAPFTFFNGNTIAAILKPLSIEVVKPLQALQGTIVLRTLSHYVVGMIDAKELEAVFRSFAPLWPKPPQPTRRGRTEVLSPSTPAVAASSPA